MPEREDQRQEGLSSIAAIIREFFVDFLSSLVPGFLFTAFTVPLVLLTADVLTPGTFHLDRMGEWAGRFPTEAWCVVLVLSYVLGSVFSRRDPKVADQKSAAYILRKDWSNIRRCVIQGRNMPKGIENVSLLQRFRMARDLAHGEGGQFPYSHLREYLQARGLGHLAELIPWSGNDESIDRRSKMFINLLKIRLQFHYQKQCADIVRNEAHVRMMSSVWYAAREFEYVNLVLAASLLTSLLWRHYSDQPHFWTDFVIVAIALICAEWLRRVILTFLHYQRVREIVFVLETAYTASKCGHHDLFEGLLDKPAEQILNSQPTPVQIPT